MQMPDHAGHEISGLKVAEISSRKGAEKAATRPPAKRTRGISGWADALARGVGHLSFSVLVFAGKFR
jgi:hypothetical protein